jgi:hypothetical protein
MGFISDIKSELGKPAGLAAAAVTLLNVAYAFPFFTHSGRSIPVFPFGNPGLRLLLLLLLGGVNGASFGWLLVRLYLRGQGFPIVWVAAVSLLAGWTAVFDIQWILIGPPKDVATHAALFTLMSMSAALHLYFIGVYSGRMGVGNRGPVYLVQVVGYAFVYFVVAVLPLYAALPSLWEVPF